MAQLGVMLMMDCQRVPLCFAEGCCVLLRTSSSAYIGFPWIAARAREVHAPDEPAVPAAAPVPPAEAQVEVQVPYGVRATACACGEVHGPQLLQRVRTL